MTETHGRTMVCVTVQRTCERLIREGARHSAGEKLTILHVVHPGQALMGFNDDPGALEYLYEIAREYGAEMSVIRADNVVDTIAEVACKNHVACIVMGMGGPRGSHNYAEALRARLPQVTVIVI